MGIFHPLLLKFADHRRDEINGQLRVSVSHGQLKLRVGFVFFLKILLGIGLDDELGERFDGFLKEFIFCDDSML